MKKTLLISGILVLTLLVGIDVMSQTIMTDRPDQTEGSTSVPKNSFQIETGMMIGYNNIDGTAYRFLVGPTTLFRVGLVKGLELRVFNQLESVKNITKEKEISGISDLEIGAKVELLNKENINTKIAFLAHLILPTGTRNLTIDSYGVINKLSISHDITESIGVGYNVGYNYYGKDRGDLTYTLVFGFSMTDKLGVFVEGYGDVADFKDNYVNFDGGLTYLIRDNLQFDFSLGTGINHYMNFFSMGISWNIGGYDSK